MIDELTLLREQRPHTTAPDQRTVTRARRALLHRALEGRRRHRRVITVGLVAAATLVVGGVVSPWGGGHRRVWLTGVERRLRGHPDLDGYGAGRGSDDLVAMATFPLTRPGDNTVPVRMETEHLAAVEKDLEQRGVP